MSAKFKLHKEKDETLTLQLRVAAIDNGWLIKAGEKPFFCENVLALKKELAHIIDEYVEANGLK